MKSPTRQSPAPNLEREPKPKPKRKLSLELDIEGTRKMFQSMFGEQAGEPRKQSAEILGWDKKEE